MPRMRFQVRRMEFNVFRKIGQKWKYQMRMSAESKQDAMSTARSVLGLDTAQVMVKLAATIACPKCGYVWDYNGTRSKFATCPNCFKQVKQKE